jgi:hypothetical protein
MTNRLMTPFCFASVMAAMLFAEGALADSFQNASSESKDSAEASARLAASGVSGVEVTMGAVAVPLAAVGAVTQGAGEVALTISGGLWDAANEPLEVSGEVLTALPPPDLTGTDDGEGR